MNREPEDQPNYLPSPSRVFSVCSKKRFVLYYASDRQLKASDYDQEIPQSQIADQPSALRGNATEHLKSQDTRKTIDQLRIFLCLPYLNSSGTQKYISLCKF